MDLQQLSSNVQDAREHYKCPICRNYMLPPIYQCHNGHTICSTCKAQEQNECRTCKMELKDIRCRTLENVVETLKYPYKNEFRGCQEMLPSERKLEVCNFRRFNCPYTGTECSFTGSIPLLVNHLRVHHKVDIDMHSGSTFNHSCEVEDATWMMRVFHCFGQYFCLHVEAFHMNTKPVYLAFLQFMGNEVEARDYFYSLEAGGNERKLIFEGKPHSLRVSPRTVRNSNDGLIIQRNMAFLFSEEDTNEFKLNVSGWIWKKQPNPDGGAS